MPKPSIAIEDLPLLADEAALFDASIDPTSLQLVDTSVIISLITNPN